jgi:protein-L-isoaspartate O-methyltransferase
VAEAQKLRHRLVQGLVQRGELDERWRAALTEVPRHVFIPDVVWRQDRYVAGDCDLVPLRRADDPEAWLELA